MGFVTTHEAAIRRHRDHRHADPIVDPEVGGQHPMIEGIQVIGCEMKTIGVFHQKLPQPHQSAPRAQLISKLGLDLKDQEGYLATRFHKRLHQVDGRFLVRHGQHHVMTRPITETNQRLIHRLVASGRLPQPPRVHHRKQHFLPADSLHLFPYHGLEAPERPHPDRGQPINAGSHLTRQTGAQS
jgi:hypothetical protein